MRVTVDQAGQQRFAAPVVDLGVAVAREDCVGWTNRANPVAFDGQSVVVMSGVGGDDGRVRKDDGPARRRLGLHAVLVEKECRRAATGASEQPAATDPQTVTATLRHACPRPSPITATSSNDAWSFGDSFVANF